MKATIHIPSFTVRRSALISLMLLVLCGAYSVAHAENLRLRAPDGKYLNAELIRGDTKRPGVLVLHGFLQTYDFLTTQTMINNIASLGYTVIGPNLSLGISDRRQSMQCEAPHTHRFEEDLREINFWVSWLRDQGHAHVIIVGHSWGSQHGLGFVEAHPLAPVAAVIAVSLVPTEQKPHVRARQITAAEAQLAQSDNSLKPYSLSFCTKFMASPQSYLSYTKWDDQRVIQSLGRLQERKLAVYVVLGSKDRRMNDEWLRALQRRTTQVTVIEGANHFFSSVHEFDLTDRIEQLMTQISATLGAK